jgi:8-oxo-dGTP pyrophosphatase MutT (NUDIX family)
VRQTGRVARYQHTPAEGDPAEVPIRDAATIMILRDEPELEVLMVQRTARMAFGARAWVFPGGRVDVEDEVATGDTMSGLTDEQASKLLGVSRGGLAWWIAGVRETVEEAGLLLVDESSEPSDHAIEMVRRAVHEDSAALAPALRAHGLRVDLSGVHEVARFITPEGPPRRFDTRFLVTKAPARQAVSPDDGEVVAARWIRPADAISLWHGNEFPLMSVTHRMLACLSRYESAASVITRAAQRPPTRRVRVDDPDGEYLVLLPEDDGYETADLEVEQGWVRL